MNPLDVISKLGSEWELILGPVVQSPSFTSLLKTIRDSSQVIYPAQDEIFTAFTHNAPSDVRVVIIGQDPYHGIDQAHGLSFSVKRGTRQPPSLRNIFKELESDLGISPPPATMGELTHWSRQGVFLINAVLTVEAGQPNTHRNMGWESFTDHAIASISENRDHVVFVLWGKDAQKKSPFNRF